MAKFIMLKLCVIAVLLASVKSVFAIVPDALTDVQAEAIQPANYPILVTVTLTNTGKAPISYWNGGPGPYPNAEMFTAKVTDEQGKTQLVRLKNGQYTMGSGINREIKTGDSVEIPASLDALPVASYSIQVGDGKAAQVSIKDDAKLVEKREQDILSGVRKGDPFLQFVTIEYNIKPVINALWLDLTGADVSVAQQAAYTLWRLRQFPNTVTPNITKAMQQQLNSVSDSYTKTNLLVYLALLASKIGSADAMVPVLALAHSDKGSETRWHAVNSLSEFKQQEATQELRRFLQDKDSRVQSAAAQALAKRKDPAAIETLVAIAHDKQNQWRAYTYKALLNFPKDPRVEPTIKLGLSDTDSFARSQAREALKELQTPR